MAESSFADRLLQIAAAIRGEEMGTIDHYAIKLETLAAEIAEPSAGTSAYEMVAATEARNIEVTESLIHMIAGTVMMRLRQAQEPVVAEHTVTFSPADMDEMHRCYDLTATHDGLLTTVTIRKRSDAEIAPPLSLRADDAWLDDTPAEPQAEEHTYDRPLWAARVEGKLYPASDQVQAERVAMQYAAEDRIATVENRFCYHDDCPSSGCNHTEATSDE